MDERRNAGLEDGTPGTDTDTGSCTQTNGTPPKSYDVQALLGIVSQKPLDGERPEAPRSTPAWEDMPFEDDLPGAAGAAPKEDGEAPALRAGDEGAGTGENAGRQSKAKKRAKAKDALASFTARRAGILDAPPPPRPFEPPEEKPYPPDPGDALMPEPGFVTDFCYSCKGKESPPIFNIFAALFAVAVASTRKARFAWAAGDFFPNLFVLFVAPPSSCTKTFAAERAHRLLQALPEELLAMGDVVLSKEKTIDYITSSATPGGIMQLMAPRDEVFQVNGGGIHVEHFGSQAYVWADEFVTFLSQQHYAEGLTDALTKWYDCRATDKETFKKESAEPLRDIYFNLAGALTPSGLQKSLPPQAFTGGFMSRVIVVSQQRPVNLFPLPENYPGFPTETDLVERLAWIAYNARGEYSFTPEAAEFYKDFYVKTKLAYFEAGTDTQTYARARHVHLTIRLAMLLRMAEYRPGTDVTLANLLKAIDLLEYTYAGANPVTADIGAAPAKKNYTRLREYVRKQGSVTRGRLLKRMSKAGCLAQEVDALLTQLAQEGSIKMYLGEHEKSGMAPSTQSSEIYKWSDQSTNEEE